MICVANTYLGASVLNASTNMTYNVLSGMLNPAITYFHTHNPHDGDAYSSDTCCDGCERGRGHWEQYCCSVQCCAEVGVCMHRSPRNFSELNRQSVFDIHRDEQGARRGAFISDGKFIVVSASWSVYTAQRATYETLRTIWPRHNSARLLRRSASHNCRSAWRKWPSIGAARLPVGR